MASSTRMGSSLQPHSLNSRRKNGLDTHSSSNSAFPPAFRAQGQKCSNQAPVGNASSTSIEGKTTSTSKRPTTPTKTVSRPNGRAGASPSGRRDSPAKSAHQSSHSPALGNIILTPSLSDLASGAGKSLGGTLGSLGSKLDIAILLAQARHATSAGQHIPPEVEALRALWRKVDLQIDQLDWEQHERMREVFYMWRRDALAAETRTKEAVAKALNEAHFHDRCKAVESKLRSDLEMLVQEMNDTVALNSQLKDQIAALKREKSIEESLNRAAVEEMARRKRHHEQDKLALAAASKKIESMGSEEAIDTDTFLDQPLHMIAKSWVEKQNGGIGASERAIADALRASLELVELQAAFRGDDDEYDPTALEGNKRRPYSAAVTATAAARPAHSRLRPTLQTRPFSAPQKTTPTSSRRLSAMPPEAATAVTNRRKSTVTPDSNGRSQLPKIRESGSKEGSCGDSTEHDNSEFLSVGPVQLLGRKGFHP